VYCSGMSSNVEKNDKIVDVYSRGKRKSLRYYALVQVNPTLSKHTTKQPEPIVIIGSELAMHITYLPDRVVPGTRLLPSCRAANGLCIVTNIGLKQKVPVVSLQMLYERFSTALSYRNWFVFSRVTYVAADPYSSYFKHGWVYPKIKPEIKEDLYNFRAVVQVKTKICTLKYHEIDEAEIPKTAPSPAPVVNEVKLDLATLLKVIDKEELTVEIAHYVKHGCFSGVALTSIYSVMDKEVFELELNRLTAGLLTQMATPAEVFIKADPVIKGSSKSLFSKVRKVQMRQVKEEHVEIPPYSESESVLDPEPVKHDPEPEPEPDPNLNWDEEDPVLLGGDGKPYPSSEEDEGQQQDEDDDEEDNGEDKEDSQDKNVNDEDI